MSSATPIISRSRSALLVALAAARGAPRPLLLAGLAILALAALGNAGLGTYHSGVEWGFWQGPTDCTGPVVNLGSAGDLLARLDTVKVVRCDEVQWRFLGLSLAGYNVLISLLMAAIAALGHLLATAKREPNRRHRPGPSEQMDDARRRDRDEHEARQMMRADEDRVDVQRQRQRQHGVHRARREGDDDVGEPHMGGQRDRPRRRPRR